ncbi:MAG: hypothetical protein JWP78_2525 [Mucilaginibacter sp.]|nr:hypothetical protein [Mucilaginibacter sp.]
MQIQVDIGFDDLIRMVKKLPGEQLLKFKSKLKKQDFADTQSQNSALFLLPAPTFSDQQPETSEQMRKAINQWRKK